MTNPTSIGSFTGFKAHEFSAHSGKTNCVAVGPRSGQVLATGGDDKVPTTVCPPASQGMDYRVDIVRFLVVLLLLVKIL